MEIPADGGKEGEVDMKELERALERYSRAADEGDGRRRRRRLGWWFLPLGIPHAGCFHQR